MYTTLRSWFFSFLRLSLHPEHTDDEKVRDEIDCPSTEALLNSLRTIALTFFVTAIGLCMLSMVVFTSVLSIWLIYAFTTNEVFLEDILYEGFSNILSDPAPFFLIQDN